MPNVIAIENNQFVKLDESRVLGMSDALKGHLIAMISHAARKHKCHWTKIIWSVKIDHGEPTIRTSHE